MTVLSRLVLNARDRQVQSDLADCQRLHSRILSCLPEVSDDAARAMLGVLYRVEDGMTPPQLLVQSAIAPGWSALPDRYVTERPQMRPMEGIYAGLQRGQCFRFRLRANPTKRVGREDLGKNGRDWSGKRVNLLREDDQLAWLARKAGKGGFEVLGVDAHSPVPNVQAASRPTQHGRRERIRLSFGAVVFDGELRVTDADLLRTVLMAGIGSGKAYGFGLLSLAPPGC